MFKNKETDFNCEPDDGLIGQMFFPVRRMQKYQRFIYLISNVNRDYQIQKSLSQSGGDEQQKYPAFDFTEKRKGVLCNFES